MNGCDLVFVDPDKGLGEGRSKEHISVDEVRELAQKHSLLIYHHLPRKDNKEHITEWLRELDVQGMASGLRAIRAARSSPRAFFLLPRKEIFGNNFKKFADAWKIFLKAKEPKRDIPHYYEL